MKQKTKRGIILAAVAVCGALLFVGPDYVPITNKRRIRT